MKITSPLANLVRTCLLPLFAVTASCPGVVAQSVESDYYTVQHYTPPKGEVIEVGGMAFLDPATLLVSTRRGRLWRVENALAAEPRDAVWKLFAEGLEEGLGLAVVDGEIYVLQRSELAKLRDLDGDGRCDEVVTVTQDWGRTTNYHEFAFGLPRDPQGNFYVGLNLGFWSPQWWHGRARAPYRGWILQVSKTGVVTPFASGARSPCGLGVNSQGDVFYTDNQGDWMATCPIFHVQKGAFFGHPASQRWTEAFGNGKQIPSSTVPLARERTPAAIWLPYAWSRSAGNLVEDQSGGGFGPFAGQMFVAELTNGMVLRTQMEKVRGEYQGAVFLFRQQLGSVCRVVFAPDHSLLIGYTNRGWGGRGPSHGLGRLRWTGRRPFEIHSVALRVDGFVLTFTAPVAESVAGTAIEAELYHYNYWWDYGSPMQGRRKVAVTSVERSADGMRLRLRIDGIEPARCIRVALPALRSATGSPLLHDCFHYTINQLPEGPLTTLRVNRQVAPPSARTGESEGWLHLTWGDALGMFESKGWTLCDVDLDAEDPSILRTRPGMGAIVNNGAEPSHLTSVVTLGDFEFRFRFMLPQKGDSGLYFMQRYELQLTDDTAALGAIVGVKPPRNGVGVYRGHGHWHTMTGRFRAPRFDAAGRRLRQARIEAVAIDDVEIITLAEPNGPTPGGESGEVARAPLRFQGDAGKICLGDVRVKALDDASAGRAAARELITGAAMPGWTSQGKARWQWSDGALRGSSGAGLLVSDAMDWRDFEVRMRLRVNDGGDAGFRFAFALDGERGYEAEINCTAAATTNTGSLVGLHDIKTDLIPAGTAFDYVVRCRRTAVGSEIHIFLNGVEVVHHLDRQRRFQGGRIALEIGSGTELLVEQFLGRRL